MSSPLEARYRLTYEDYLALTKAFARLTPMRRACLYALPLLIGLSLLLAGYFTWVQYDWPLAVYFAVVAGLLAFLRLVVGPWQQRRTFRNQRLGDFDIALTADEDGFQIYSELSEGRQKWGFIRRVDDMAEHVILWPNDRLGWIVPKRGFAGTAEAQAFARLAKEKTVGQTL